MVMIGTEFDARRDLLALRGNRSPIVDWPVHVAMMALRERLMTPPWLDEDVDGRVQEMADLIDNLESAGIDSATFIRYGLGDRLERAIITGVLVACAVRASAKGILGDTDIVEQTADLESFADEWAHCYQNLKHFEVTRSVPIDPGMRHPFPPDPDEPPPEDATEVEPLPVRTVQRLLDDAAVAHVRAWVQQADLRSLLAWAPQATAVPVDPLDKSLIDTYRWLAERMTVTYPAQWATSSLHLEWTWINGERSAPFNCLALEARSVDLAPLNAEIAQRAVRAGKPDAGLTLDQVANQALQLLEAGNRQAAAGLFEAICSRQPESAEAQNNLGFCLLPDQPAEAVQYLALARRLGYENTAINALNRMQAHMMAGQHRTALGIAQEIWGGWERHAPRGAAFLWRLPKEPVPIRVTDARAAVLWLAATASRQVGDQSADIWAERHDRFCTDCSGESAPCSELDPLTA